MGETCTLKTWLHSRSGLLCFLILVFIAGWLRFYDLGTESLWLDEAYSEDFVKSDATHIIKTSGRYRNNPPLYWVILHYWVRLFGNTEGSLRAPSAIFGVAAVLIMFLLGRRLLDSRTALLGTFLCAFSQFHIFYSQEARPYSLLLLLSITSYLFFVRLIKPGHRRSNYVWYALTTIALCYTHVYGIFIIASQFGYLVIRGRNCQHQRYLFWGTFAFIAASLLPLMLILGPSTQKISSQGFWIAKPSVLTVANIFAYYAGEGGKHRIILLGLYAFLTLLSLASITVKDIHWNPARPVECIKSMRSRVMVRLDDVNLLLISWLGVSIIAPLIISIITTPVLYPRYTIGASPALYLLVARGIRTAGVRRGVGIVLLIIIFAGWDLRDYYRYDVKEQWHEAADLISSVAESSDYILIGSCCELPFNYYYKGSLPVVGTKRSVRPEELADYLREAASGKNRVWVISRDSRSGETFQASLKDALKGHHLSLEKKLKGLEIFLIDFR
jgi:uncharacterized membrane protein